MILRVLFRIVEMYVQQIRSIFDIQYYSLCDKNSNHYSHLYDRMCVSLEKYFIFSVHIMSSCA